MESPDGGGHFAAVTALAYDMEAAGRTQDPSQAGANQLLIVDEQDPDDGAFGAH
jgi:hypothetical protein